MDAIGKALFLCSLAEGLEPLLGTVL